jgi:hypothetical protein
MRGTSLQESNAETNRYWSPRRIVYIRGLLRIVGAITLLAFAAGIMPNAWFVEISRFLGYEFPQQPLGFYLARHLSILYGFVGIGLLVLASDLHRYGPLVRWLGWGAIVLGVLQVMFDFWAGLSWLWALGEGLSTVFGGLLILWLCHWCRGTSDHPA